MRPLQILLLSTPVGPIGSGQGGGVELTIANLAGALHLRGHRVEVVAPVGSQLPAGVPLREVPGRLHENAQHQQPGHELQLPEGSVLASMWRHAREVEESHDILLNLAFDWLPFYLTPFFCRPLAHLVSMGSLGPPMDSVITGTARRHPGAVAFHTQAQAATFSGLQHSRYRCLGNAIDLSRYRFCSDPSSALAWAGRIAPEKGLEDALEAVRRAGGSLKIMGKVQDERYWQRLCREYPEAAAGYAGFLPTDQLQTELGHCRALLMTPHWVEAFGNVAIEALACGVPVIAYRRGGPAEIVTDGETGWLVQPQHLQGLVTAIGALDRIERTACRRRAEEHYSLPAFGARVESWLRDLIPGSTGS